MIFCMICLMTLYLTTLKNKSGGSLRTKVRVSILLGLLERWWWVDEWVKMVFVFLCEKMLCLFFPNS